MGVVCRRAVLVPRPGPRAAYQLSERYASISARRIMEYRCKWLHQQSVVYSEGVAPATEFVRARGDATDAGTNCSTGMVCGARGGRCPVLTHITGVFRNLPDQTKRRVVALYVGLIALNIVAWFLA